MKVNSLYPIIATDHLEETIAFYGNFGFEVKHKVVTKANSHLCILGNGEQEIELIESVKDSPVPIPAGIYGLRMNVADIEAAAEELKQKGATIVAGPIMTGNGKNLMIKDDQGINITLVQHIKKQGPERQDD